MRISRLKSSVLIGASVFIALTATAQPRIVIDKSDFTLTLYDGKDVVKVYSVAVGKNLGDKEKVGDMRTPIGKFPIVNIHNSSAWTHDFKDGKGEIKGAYGPWFLRLYTGKDATASGKAWKGIGIHGTHAPESIGTCATEGCIRLKNEDIADLKARIKIGTPVEIQE
ncbi:MAG: L,D-transpeptidase [Chloroherpetonaceae bacterium]